MPPLLPLYSTYLYPHTAFGLVTGAERVLFIYVCVSVCCLSLCERVGLLFCACFLSLCVCVCVYAKLVPKATLLWKRIGKFFSTTKNFEKESYLTSNPPPPPPRPPPPHPCPRCSPSDSPHLATHMTSYMSCSLSRFLLQERVTFSLPWLSYPVRESYKHSDPIIEILDYK